MGDYLSYDPYGIMYRKNDGDFGLVITRALAGLMRGEQMGKLGAIEKIYNKWFIEKLPDGVVMGMPMTQLLRDALIANALPE